MRLVRILASLLVTAFLILAPAPLRRALERDPMRELFENEPPDWYGVIEIWHIAGFRTYQGSVTNFLQECCDAFARSHPGVHFEITGLTPDMYKDRAARGLSPDAYSFPAGFLAADLFRPLTVDPPILRDGVAADPTGSIRLAAPYLMSGYFLLLNEQLALTDGGTLPDAVSRPLLSKLQEDGQLCFPAALGESLGLVGEPRDYNDFLAEKCTAAIADARSLGDLLRDTEQNLLVTALPLGGYTDQVMYFGAAADTDDRRAALIGELYNDLLSESVQQKLTTLGAMPVRKYLGQITYSTRLLEALYAAYLGKTQTPAPFAA